MERGGEPYTEGHTHSSPIPASGFIHRSVHLWADKGQKRRKRAASRQRSKCTEGFEGVCARERERGRERRREREGLSELLKSVLFHLVMYRLSVQRELSDIRHTTTHTHTYRVQRFSAFTAGCIRIVGNVQPEQNNMSNPQSRASGKETHADFSGTKILLCYNYVNYIIFYIILYYT